MRRGRKGKRRMRKRRERGGGVQWREIEKRWKQDKSVSREGEKKGRVRESGSALSESVSTAIGLLKELRERTIWPASVSER